jgi:hypothetical protein
MTEFATDFDRFVCVGDSIECDHAGFTVRAAVEYDGDVSPDDFECYGDDDASRWRNGDWFYCGLVLSAWLGETRLVKHAASLWGIEANISADNAYLREAANELLPEAIEELDGALDQLSYAIERHQQGA